MSKANTSPPPNPPGSDRLALVQAFVRIVEAGSLSAAAQQLGTTQPTISRRLQALEKAWGVRLLQRNTHTMALTPDGELALQRGRQLLADWAAFEADLRGARAAPSGLLRVVAPHAFGQQALVGPLLAYLQAHPAVAVEWLLHDDAQNLIGQGIDCLIQVGEVSDPALVALRLAEVPRIVVAAPALLGAGPVPQAPDELAKLPWLALRTYYRQSVTLQHTGSGASHTLPIAPRLSTDSLFALREAALQGMGLAIVSAWVVADDLAHGRLRQVAPDWQAPSLPVVLAYPWAGHYPARLLAFVAAMREALPTLAGMRPPARPGGMSTPR